ncbi:MAG: ATP-binding cassette domain-containing protein [Elusimicrobia bacterium]|nr:ATP-binding cassette domain-containing protein [Elusimicrobiota bacterium]
MRPIIDVQELSVIRGDVTVLDRLHWKVEAGEHWAVLGPNGSGKTSLLAALPGTLAPDRGTVDVLGHRPGGKGWGEVRNRIGVVSSSLAAQINPREAALDTVRSGQYGALGFLKRYFSNDRRRALRMMRLTGCRELAERPWSALSQGEKQRVLISRALMVRPRLLILDEPCAGLDFPAREKFLRFLGRFSRLPGAPTLLLATHHTEEISPAFKHVLILKKGRAVAAGGIEETLNSANISAAFGARLRVKFRRRRFYMARARP